MATSKLQRQVSNMLSVHFGQYTIRENHHPDWLGGLELDFYIEELETGIEVQGRQHFEFSPLFHKSNADFEAQQARDVHKAEICAKRDIGLYYIRYPSRLIELLDCLNRVSAVYQESQNRIRPDDKSLRTPKQCPAYYKLYGKVCRAYHIQDISALQRLFHRLEWMVKKERLYIPNKHLRRLLEIRKALYG